MSLSLSLTYGRGAAATDGVWPYGTLLVCFRFIEKSAAKVSRKSELCRFYNTNPIIAI